MKNVNIFFLSQSSGQNINRFKREMEGGGVGMNQHCGVTQIYIYQIGPFKSRALVRTQHNW